MIEKQLGGMSPTKLRVTLVITIVVMLILSAVGFWFFRGWLVDYAQTVNKDSQDAAVSSNDIATLQRLKTELDQDSVAVNRTKSIVADSKSYQYQNQIITDLNAYAKASGVTIAGYGFDVAGSTTGGTTAGAATPAAGATTPATTAPAGLKTTSVQVTMKNPVKYESIMRFIHAIEANLTKMQLTGVSFKQDSTTGIDAVTVDPLTVEVYIR